MKRANSQQIEAWRKRREQMVAMRVAGLSLEQIAAAMKCSRQRVHQILSMQAKRA